ncbi:C10 family peptidase [Flavobacterium restrictum]|uniref:Spi protease inhibitor domain-containing protein n=1 Tax=Flavobacterium restrictum TaxID=2594428 RepID=A0A553EAS5_9FLAO|nr:C10 family peptidase [Flavobacterium restrictum]TRX42138.1 hypothetical protein FNW21_02395 [Flavobacterium restrictum]
MKTKQNKTKFEISKVIRLCFKNIYLFFLAIVFLASCSKDTPVNIELQNNLNEVPKTTIIEIAQKIFKNSGSINSRVVNSNKTIKEIVEHQTNKNKTAFYVINYNEGGFAVIAADNRVTPILAYSDSGSFSSIPSEIISPIKDWIIAEKEQIQYVIDNNLTQNKDRKLEWEKVTENNSLLQVKGTSISAREPLPSPKDCPDTSVIKGPLTTTIWGQSNGYNNLVTVNCNPTYQNAGKAVTGCVATAMAQIMRYFHKPNTYNWANMPNDGSGSFASTDIQSLMRDAGLAVNMNYGCIESGAYANAIAPALKNTFGYTNASFTTNYDYNIITNNINVNKPVILCGSGSNGGHAWVCDGYNSSTYYEKDTAGNCTGIAVTTLYLHMNWGWYSSNNGYYAFDNFNPYIYTFNNNRSIIYNINL